MDMVVEAIKYFEANFSIIPVSRAKKPIIRWRKYQEQRASNAEILNWFGANTRNCIGIVTGPLSNLTVVDTDNENGIKVISDMLPFGFNCPKVRTPRGGVHFYFQYEPRLRNQQGIIPGIDVRSEGGFVVAPPSIGPNGNGYEWIEPIGDTGVPKIPEEVVSFILRGRNPSGGNPPGRSSGILDQGSRDNTLFYVALKLAKAGAEKSYVEEVIIGLAKSCNPPFGLGEAKKKVDSAFSYVHERGGRPSMFVKMSEITPLRQRWLWPKMFPLGCISLLAGPTHLGKSTFAMWMAGIITSQTPWPGGNRKPPAGSVIILSGEENIDDIVWARLKAAGANLDKVTALRGGLSLDKDLALLEEEIQKHGDVVLVIIDPISSFTGVVKDENQPLRAKIYAPLKSLAEKYNLAILSISHFGKDGNQPSINRVLGSLAHVAAPRCVWAVLKDSRPGSPDNGRVLHNIKLNIAKAPPSYEFLVRGTKRPPIVFSPHPIDPKSVNHLIDGDDERTDALKEAADMLISILRRKGKAKVSDVFRQTRSRGISDSTVRRAKMKLKIVAKKGNKSDDGQWSWFLPRKRGRR